MSIYCLLNATHSYRKESNVLVATSRSYMLFTLNELKCGHSTTGVVIELTKNLRKNEHTKCIYFGLEHKRFSNRIHLRPGSRRSTHVPNYNLTDNEDIGNEKRKRRRLKRRWRCSRLQSDRLRYIEKCSVVNTMLY